MKDKLEYCTRCGEPMILPDEYNEVAGVCTTCEPCRCEDEEER